MSKRLNQIIDLSDGKNIILSINKQKIGIWLVYRALDTKYGMVRLYFTLPDRKNIKIECLLDGFLYEECLLDGFFIKELVSFVEIIELIHLFKEDPSNIPYLRFLKLKKPLF